MKPNRIQYIFAKDYPLAAWFLAFALFSAALVIKECQPSTAVFLDLPYLLLFLFSLLLAPVLGFFLSLPFAWVLVRPLYDFRARLNGAPFYPGDRVRILVGPHCGRVANIYQVWDIRGQVRVELDEQSKKEMKDVFSFTQVCHESYA